MAACLLGIGIYNAIHQNLLSGSLLHNTPQPIVIADMEMFTNISTLAAQLPDFDSMLDNITDMHLRIKGVRSQFDETSLSTECRNDLALLLDTITDTLQAIQGALTVLSVDSSYVVYRFRQFINNLMNHPPTTPLMYRGVSSELTVLLEKLALYPQRLQMRYEFVKILLINPMDICKRDPYLKGENVAIKAWKKVFHKNVDRLSLEEDIQLFQNFVSSQGERQMVLEQIQRITDGFLHTVEQMFGLTRYSPISVSEDVDLWDLEHVVANLTKILKDQIRM